MATLGRVAIVPEGIPTAINTKHLCCITLDERCTPQFLWASMLFDLDLRSQLGLSERGAIMPGLNMDLISRLAISLPPRSLQDQFCVLLNATARTITGVEASLKRTDALFSSLQHRAFRGEL